MNILLITQIYPEPDDQDGYKPTRTVEYFAKEWVLLGHRVVVIHCQTKFPVFYYMIPKKITKYVLRNSYALIPAFSSRKALRRTEKGIEIYRAPMKKIVPSTSFSKNEMKKQMNRIVEICKNAGFQPDIVAGHFLNPCLELTARLGNYFNARTSFVFHNDCSEKNIEKYDMREYVKGIDRFGGRSLIEVAHIREVLGLKYTPFVCYSGVPNETVLKARKSCDKHYESNIAFLYAGGLVLKKHVDSIIKAFIDVYKNGYRLTIVGGGPEELNLRSIAEQSEHGDAVFFTGRLTREQVSEQMEKANVFAMISEGETFGMVYLEAMLQGCIVIASEGGGFDGIIENGKNGFLCRAGDTEHLKDVFRSILDLSTEERVRIGKAAISTAVNFSERDVAKNYIDEITK